MQACSVSNTVLDKEGATQNETIESSSSVKMLPMRNYQLAMRSDNSGLVESSIFQSLVYWRKTGNPDTAALISEMDKLQTDGATSAIRYQAFLASYILKDEVIMYLVLDPSLYKSSREYFKDLGKYVNEDLANSVTDSSL